MTTATPEPPTSPLPWWRVDAMSGPRLGRTQVRADKGVLVATFYSRTDADAACHAVNSHAALRARAEAAEARLNTLAGIWRRMPQILRDLVTHYAPQIAEPLEALAFPAPESSGAEHQKAVRAMLDARVTCVICRHTAHGIWCPNMASDGECGCTHVTESSPPEATDGR